MAKITPKEFVDIRTKHAAEKGWGAPFDSKLLARIADGTVSRHDIDDAAKAAAEAWKKSQEIGAQGAGTPAAWRAHDEAMHKELSNSGLREVLVEQYRSQSNWRSMIEDVKDGVGKWGEAMQRISKEIETDPHKIVRNMR